MNIELGLQLNHAKSNEDSSVCMHVRVFGNSDLYKTFIALF